MRDLRAGKADFRKQYIWVSFLYLFYVLSSFSWHIYSEKRSFLSQYAMAFLFCLLFGCAGLTLAGIGLTKMSFRDGIFNQQLSIGLLFYLSGIFAHFFVVRRLLNKYSYCLD